METTCSWTFHGVIRGHHNSNFSIPNISVYPTFQYTQHFSIPNISVYLTPHGPVVFVIVRSYCTLIYLCQSIIFIRVTVLLLQECHSPNLSKSFYRTSSMDLALKRNSLNNISPRRSSLQHLNTIPFESSLHRRSSLDPLTLRKYQFGLMEHSPLEGHSQSLGKLHSPSNRGRGISCSSLIDVHTPHSINAHLSRQNSTSQLSNHGSNTQLSNHGSNTSLNDHIAPPSLHSFPTFPSPDEFPFNERSKSLGNIFSSIGQRPLQHANSFGGDGSHGYSGGGMRGQKRGLGSLGRGAVKKPR